MKNQALFSSKDKSKKLKCRLLQFLLSALRVSDSYFPKRVYVKYKNAILSHKGCCFRTQKD